MKLTKWPLCEHQGVVAKTMPEAAMTVLALDSATLRHVARCSKDKRLVSSIQEELRRRKVRKYTRALDVF